MIETIREEEEDIKQENWRLKEWTEKDDDEIENMVNPYYKL